MRLIDTLVTSLVLYGVATPNAQMERVVHAVGMFYALHLRAQVPSAGKQTASLAWRTIEAT